MGFIILAIFCLVGSMLTWQILRWRSMMEGDLEITTVVLCSRTLQGTVACHEAMDVRAFVDTDAGRVMIFRDFE
jgi:hypothetical protein